MAIKQTPPFRVEHVGSLLRPDYLLEARSKFDKKELTQEQLKVFEDRAIKEAVDLQRAVGIRGITDGEYSRHMFFDGFFEYLDGFEDIQNPPMEIYKLYVPDIPAFLASGTKPASTTLCTGKIRYVKSGYIPQYEALKKHVPADEVKNIKLTMAPPEWCHLHHGEHAYRPGVYNNLEEYYHDIAVAYRKEISVLYNAGLRNLQIDDPLLAYFCDVSMLTGMREVGEDPEALLDRYIQLYADCLKDRPRDLRISMHICRGNFKDGMHFSEGGYDAIAIKLFNSLDIDSYYLEYDTPRAGTFEPLRYLPKHKSVVLGLVTSKFPQLEDKDELAKRVFEAAYIMASGSGESVQEALKRVSVSPQCGFASHAEGNPLTAADMKRKLELVRDLAATIWTDA